MADNIDEIINRLKAKKNSQQSNEKPVKVAVPVPQPIEDEIEFEDTEEKADNVKVNQENTKNTQDSENKEDKEIAKLQIEEAKVQQILEQIELMQNNGRFRVELLFQLQQINKALVVIASKGLDNEK